MLALGEMYFQGIKAVAKGGWRCWYWVKCVSRAWREFRRGFKVFALGEMCFIGRGAVAKGG